MDQSTKTTPKVLLLAMILAVSMTTIDQTIVALSAGTIQSALGISHQAMTWAVNTYILATAAFFVLGGKLTDVFGHKRMAIIGIAGFALFSLLCGLTPSGVIAAPWLITMRVFQGISAAIMFPAALGMVYSCYPVGKRGQAMSLFFGISGAMTAIGPIFGGYLTQWTWRSIFWINIPIALISLAILAGQNVVIKRKMESIDIRGALLIAAAMTFIVLGLQQAAVWGWGSVLTIGSIVLGAIALGLFVRYERTAASPLVKLQAFRDRGFTLSVLATLFSSFAFIPIFFFLSVYGQVSLGLNVNTTGLLLLEFFIGFTFAARGGGQLFDRRGAKLPLMIGGAMGAAGFIWWASKLGTITNGGEFFGSPQFWPTILAGAGIGYMFSAASTDVVNRSVDESYGEATGISQTAKNFGGALGLALLAALLTTQLTTKLTSSFTALGASASDAKAVVQSISGAESKENKQAQALPKEIQDKFNHAVQTDYAEATKIVFYMMGGAMAIVFLLGLLYPGGYGTLPASKREDA